MWGSIEVVTECTAVENAGLERARNLFSHAQGLKCFLKEWSGLKDVYIQYMTMSFADSRVCSRVEIL